MMQEVASSATARCLVDVWNEVPLVPQTTGMSCWAAAAAMLVGWRDRVPVSPEEVARGAGRWHDYRDGLHPNDVETLARTWGLSPEPPGRWTVERLARTLTGFGPLWLGEASPGLHSIVVTGLYGDGTPGGTLVRINDPWPVGRGERYLLAYRDLMRNLRAASALVGGNGQVLHSGGRGRGRSSVRFQERRESTRVFSSTPRAAGPLLGGARWLPGGELPGDPLGARGDPAPALHVAWSRVPPRARAVDVVLHCHGDVASLERAVAASGIDLARRARPTLVLVPRASRGSPDVFPALLEGGGAGLERAVASALDWFRGAVLEGAALPAIARLVFTARSGGGAALDALLRSHRSRRVCDPDEVHAFDALPPDSGGVAAWAASRLARDLAAAPGRLRADMRDRGGGCRILFTAATAEGARAVAQALRGAAPPPASHLAPFYRVQRITTAPRDLARRFGPAFLGDVSADASASLAASPAYGLPLGLFHVSASGDDDAPGMPDRSRMTEWAGRIVSPSRRRLRTRGRPR